MRQGVLELLVEGGAGRPRVLKLPPQRGRVASGGGLGLAQLLAQGANVGLGLLEPCAQRRDLGLRLLAGRMAARGGPQGARVSGAIGLMLGFCWLPRPMGRRAPTPATEPDESFQ